MFVIIINKLSTSMINNKHDRFSSKYILSNCITYVYSYFTLPMSFIILNLNLNISIYTFYVFSR